MTTCDICEADATPLVNLPHMLVCQSCHALATAIADEKLRAIVAWMTRKNEEDAA